MYFSMKSYLKNTRNHTAKHAHNVPIYVSFEVPHIDCSPTRSQLFIVLDINFKDFYRPFLCSWTRKRRGESGRLALALSFLRRQAQY
jgi:hypothetical protein